MFFKSNPRTRMSARLLCGASIGVMAAVSPVFAQTVAADVVPETVTVTGTLIKGINPVGTNIIGVDATNIQQQGLLTTDQILTEIPEITNTFNSLGNPTSGASNFQGLRPSIRSLTTTTITGGSPTLVLVDGHNWVGVNSLGTAPDPGILPTGVLQRVDVMPDGGSSMYGANAITGVINFITRTSYTGLQISAQQGFADGYQANDQGLIFGQSWSSGNVFAAFENKGNTFLFSNARPEYTKQNLNSINGRDTEATACALPNITAGANNYAQTAPVANTAGTLKANVTGPFDAVISNSNSGVPITVNGVAGTATARPNAFNRCDTTANSQIAPKEQADSFFMGFSQHIVEGVDLSAKMIWSSRLDTQVANQLSATVTIDNTNPYFQSINGETQQNVQFSFSPYLGQNVGSSGLTGNKVYNSSIIQVFQFTPDLHIALPWGDWEADLLANYGRSYSVGVTRGVNTTALGIAARAQIIGGVATPTLVADPVVGNAVDPYNISLTNPTLLNTILNWGNIGKAVQRQNQLQATVDGTLFDWWGGSIKAAIGAKYSYDGYAAFWSVNSPLAQQQGNTIVGGQLVNEKTHRSTTSVYGEVNVPVVSRDNAVPFVKSLTLDISGRYDDYSDFGDAETFKLGFTYQPFEEVSIRGNMGTSFDAPSLADTLAPDGRYSYSPQRTSPNTDVPAGTSAADALRPSISVPGGNPNLGPETANTNSIGADFNPGEYFGVDFTGLDLSVTAWHIFIEHQIGLIQGAIRYQVPAYSQYYILNPTIAQIQARYGYGTAVGFPGLNLLSAYPVSLGGTAPNGSIQAPYILEDLRRNNLGNALLEGIDFKVAYSRMFDFGTLSAGVSGTNSSRAESQGDFGQAFTNLQVGGVPLYQLNINLGYASGPLSVRGSMNYSPSYAVLPTSTTFTTYGQSRIGSFSPINISGSYDLGGISDWTSGTTASLAINNVLDANPPIQLSGGTANGSTLGRYFQIGLIKKF